MSGSSPTPSATAFLLRALLIGAVAAGVYALGTTFPLVRHACRQAGEETASGGARRPPGGASRGLPGRPLAQTSEPVADLPVLGERLFSAAASEKRPSELSVHRLEGSRESLPGELDGRFGEKGWKRDRSLAGSGQTPVLLYTKGRRRCLVSFGKADVPGRCEVMVLCDR